MPDTLKPAPATVADSVHGFPATDFPAREGDLRAGLRNWRLWTTLAWHSLHQRYRRTWIGMGWVSLSFALFALVKVVVFGPFSGMPIAEFAAFLVLGFMAFRFVANTVTGGAGLFIGAQSWIKSEPLPLSVHIYKLITTNFIIMGFAAIPALAVCVWAGALHINALYSLPFILLAYALNGVWIGLVMGILCARYRDVMHFTSTVMQVLYFATPILWVPPETGLRAQVALYNPVTHFIDVLRLPMLDGTIPWLSWAVVGSVTLMGLLVGSIVWARQHKRLVFWL